MRDFQIFPSREEEERAKGLLRARSFSHFDEEELIVWTPEIQDALEREMIESQRINGLPLGISSATEAKVADTQVSAAAEQASQESTAPKVEEAVQKVSASEQQIAPQEVASTSQAQKTKRKAKTQNARKETFDAQKRLLEPLQEEKKKAVRLAKQEYIAFKKSADTALRKNKAQRLEVRMKFKAFERMVEKQGLTFGTATFATAFADFFPGNSFIITVDEALEARIDEARVPISTTSDSATQKADSNSSPEEAQESNEKLNKPKESQNSEEAKTQKTTKVKKASSEKGENGAANENGAAKGDKDSETTKTDKSSTENYVNSLGQVGPVQFVEEMQAAKSTASELQQTEKEDLKSKLPTIEQPTGLAVKEKGEEKAKKEGKESPTEAKKLMPEGERERSLRVLVFSSSSFLRIIVFLYVSTKTLHNDLNAGILFVLAEKWYYY